MSDVEGATLRLNVQANRGGRFRMRNNGSFACQEATARRFRAPKGTVAKAGAAVFAVKKAFLSGI